MSEVVKSQFGYHIIKTVAKQAATTSTLEQVRPQIEERSSTSAREGRRSHRHQPRRQADQARRSRHRRQGERVDGGRDAVLRRATIRSSGLGSAPAIENRAFELKAGEVSEGLRMPRGQAFITVTGTQDSRLPTLDEVKARVREDLQKTKAAEAARQKAAALVAQLKSRRLHRRGQGRRTRGQDDRTHRPRPADSRRRRQRRDRHRRLRLARRRRQRRHHDRQRRGHRQGAGKEGADRGRDQERPRDGEDAAAQPAAPALLRRLHGQGARADDHPLEPAGVAQVIG